MARVKDTGPGAASATVPTAGKKTTKEDKLKDSTAGEGKVPPVRKTARAKKNAEVEIKPNETGHPIGVETAVEESIQVEPKKVKGKAKKKDDAVAEPTDVEPKKENNKRKKKDEAPESVDVEPKKENNRRKKKDEAPESVDVEPKKAKGKGKKNDDDAPVDEPAEKKSKKSKTSEAKPIEATVKKVAKDAADAAQDVAAEVKSRATKAKKALENELAEPKKRKTTATTDAEGEKASKKSKKSQNTNADVDKPSKKKTAAKESSTKDAGDAKPSGGKGKKRKVDEAEEVAGEDESILANAAKKVKKAAKKAGDGLANMLTSGTSLLTNAIPEQQTSIAEDIADLAEDAVQSKPKGSKSSSKSKKSAKSAMEPTEAEVDADDDAAGDHAIAAEEAEEDEDEWEPEDDVAQLITGFESGSEDDDSGDEGFKQGKAIPKLPKQKTLTAKERSSNSSDKPGVIYIGRVPHGFHEHEMRAYFSQFGDVNHVRLSRSRKTGKSKHYAFLEFKSEEVAKIAAKTMDKYLLFGHILRCSFVPQEQVHPELWKGADKRFKAVPWARIAGRKLTRPKGRTEWSKNVEKESRRRASKAQKLKEIGYEFEPTELTAVDSVPKQILVLPGAPVVEEEKTIVVGREENTLVVSEEIKTKKTKKQKKAVGETASAAVESETSAGTDQAPPEDGKRVKKPSKRALEASEEVTETKKKVKKSKKAS